MFWHVIGLFCSLMGVFIGLFSIFMGAHGGRTLGPCGREERGKTRAHSLPAPMFLNVLLMCC